MIEPKKFTVEDFQDAAELDTRALNSIKMEALTGAELVDNLILLKFCTTHAVQSVLKEKYGMPFAWLNMDSTPPDMKEVADKHHVIIERSRNFVVYVPLGQRVDDAMLAIDIPNYQIIYRFIADCNYRLLKRRMTANLLSEMVAPYRPLLVFRRLIIDCIDLSGTDVHFSSVYNEKNPTHLIQNRVSQDLVPSQFLIDKAMMFKVLQAVITKLTPTSAMDLDANEGISTEVRDLFEDGSTDLRITGTKVDAGYYIVCTVQNVTTTTKKVDELGFPAPDVQLLRELAQRRTGLTLVTGKMRSGKNTTIFGMLNELTGLPIRIMEYSFPIENHMGFPQVNYQGDIDRLKNLMRLAKKMDLNVAVLNEIPDSGVAFAVRDLVNSAVAVITTMHIDRVWHMPYKMQEFFGRDYKTVISQINAVINHKMFKKWKGPGLQKRQLVKEHGDFEMFCYKAGVRQYFVPTDPNQMRYSVQPLIEIVVLTSEMKTAILNFDEIWRAEQMLRNQIEQRHETLENKLAQYINDGLMSIEEMRQLHH